MRAIKTEQKLYCGIDVSGDTLDICYQSPEGSLEWCKCSNNAEGFKEIWQHTGKLYHFVMESTGVYQLPFCFFLESKKARYSVVNALQIKRYIQMKLERNKTDKKDAFHICMYGLDHNPECYQMPSHLYFECRAINNAIETITTEITSFKNKLHSLSKLDIDSKVIVAGYKKILRDLQAELKKFETELYKKLEAWQPALLKRVRSVVGIGKRATAILIVTTQGFKHTETYQQLISYAGLSPKEYSSGSSIRGKVRICKQGGSLLRHTLYMCALNAKETNGACKELFDRLVAKGKNKKLAVIAVANKLLKQVFGVVKNECLFDRNYYKKTA
jgi:transposase